MPDHLEELRTLAGAVHAACIKAARNGYQDAAISGLCGEGAQEAALSAIQMVDIESIIMSRELTILKADE
ncbi:MAG: acetyltransferase [Pseudomonadota bacterium]